MSFAEKHSGYGTSSQKKNRKNTVNFIGKSDLFRNLLLNYKIEWSQVETNLKHIRWLFSLSQVTKFITPKYLIVITNCFLYIAVLSEVDCDWIFLCPCLQLHTVIIGPASVLFLFLLCSLQGYNTVDTVFFQCWSLFESDWITEKGKIKPLFTVKGI